MHTPRTFLTSLFDSGWWKEPAMLVMVMLRSDWFSTFKNILFRSPFTTSTSQRVQWGRSCFRDRHLRPKALSSGS